MRFKKVAAIPLVGAALMIGGTIAMAAGPTFHEVHPKSFDPAHTFLVQSDWSQGLGCPTDAHTSSDAVNLDGTFSDPACPSGAGDPKDKKNQGLILSKAVTGNYAAAQAELKDVKGMTLTELGYDLRKPGGDTSDPRGSHCDHGAPRFDITMQDGTLYFIGCDSPPAAQSPGQAWIRLRWSGPVMAFRSDDPVTPRDITGMAVQSISIVFDEGSDIGPDNFGLAVLDNIDVNGVLVGQGPHGDN